MGRAAKKEQITIGPQDGPQTTFLTSPADIAIYGGISGGGKSYALLLEPLYHISKVQGFGAVAFRRTTPQLRGEGGLWDTLLPDLSRTWAASGGKRTWSGSSRRTRTK